ncbi:MAG: T9SS type A sorting domain-containing protein, partial [Flavobacteriales bacterium]|nr:T9SS type A sorting domain-containing protein [Flavobacteriales bacterium]
ETISGTDYSTKNFWYYSLQTGEVIDREPVAESWDITFTRYSSEIFPGANYIVSGVFQNQEVLASEARTVEIDDAQWTDQPMSEEMNIIGSDWKYFDMDIFQYVVEDSLSYFVQDREGNVWHLWFTAFDGSSTGDIEFTKQMVSATGVDDIGQVDFTVFPNPVIGQAQVVLAVENEPIRYSLFDMNGRIVAKDTWTNGLRHSLDVSALQQGIYMLQVERDGGFGQQRILVQ